MRFPGALLPLLLVACATPPRLVRVANDTVGTAAEAATDLAAADVVVLGEMHETPDLHSLHLELVRELHLRRPELVIAMEMFERDVQTSLSQYLASVLDEDAFLAAARPWRTYGRDYRPLVEFAKEHGLLVLAANAPKELAARVAEQGIASIAGERHAPRETTAPEDEYWDAFQETMKEGSHGKPGTPEEEAAKTHRYYEAQCLRDDTMAETIVDHLRERRVAGARPLYVLVCGQRHSDFGRGVVARIKSRMPDLAVRIVSTEQVADMSESRYASPKTKADWIVVLQGGAQRAAPAAVQTAQPARPARPAAPVAGTSPTAGPPAGAGTGAGTGTGNEAGLRPALGLMPDYQDTGGKGVLVASVREGGSAYKAGIEPGDYIVNLGGIDVPDVQSYAEALDQMVIGKTITVRIRRDDAEVALQVLVASRSR